MKIEWEGKIVEGEEAREAWRKSMMQVGSESEEEKKKI